VKAAADLRNRAFTLFTRGYDQMRRAVAFLRWDEGDADKVVPSLYAKHRRSKKKTDTTRTRERPGKVLPVDVPAVALRSPRQETGRPGAPARHFEASERAPARVNIDYPVAFDDHLYSVPQAPVSEHIEIRALRASSKSCTQASGHANDGDPLVTESGCELELSVDRRQVEAKRSYLTVVRRRRFFPLRAGPSGRGRT
jgi:hypothetical protein